jgi:uridylate kinase
LLVSNQLAILLRMVGLEKKIVISLGGSLIVPKAGIDTVFLTQLNAFIRTKLAQDPALQFFLICGGGSTTRSYQKAAREVVGEIPAEDVDWLGIHATRLNGHLLRTIFADIAHPKMLEHYNEIPEVRESVIVGAGWKPGHSTDYCAVQMATNYGASVVLNLSDISQVHDKDPKEFPDARPLERLNWDSLLQITGEVWSPGLNVPFDPEASKLARNSGLTVVLLSGKDFDNLDRFFTGEEFLGTVIE